VIARWGVRLSRTIESGAGRAPSRLPLTRLLVVAGLGSLTAGCLSADPPPPNLEIPGRYREASKGADAARPHPGWWRAFRSTELSRLIEDARADNLDIAAAVARIRQADAQSRIAGAALLPTLDGGADASRSRSAGLATGHVGKGNNLYSLTLNASFELDFWGKNQAALDAARDAGLANRYDRETVELTAIASAATTYFELLGAQDRLRIARENVENASRVLGIIQQRLNAGTATALDLAEQQSLLAQQRASIPPLEQTIGQNRATLAVLVGRPPASVTVVGGSTDRVGIPRISPGLPADLLNQRPDIRFAEATLASANANVVLARAQFFPTITLTGQGGLESQALKSLFEPSSTFYSIAAGLTQPIFEGGRLHGQFDQAKGVEDEALANYRKAVISAFSDVESALVAVRQLARQEALQRDVVKSARTAYELSEKQLREGTVDLTTVLTNQNTLFQAQNSLVLVRVSRLQAVVSLYQALGGGWEAPDTAVTADVAEAK